MKRLIEKGWDMADRKAALIIVAAGQGTRLGGAPKQYRDLHGKPVLSHLLARAAAIPAIGPIISVTHPDHGDAYAGALAASGVTGERTFRAPGGPSRQASVRNGLEFLAAADFPEDGIVLIHDAARPFLSEVVVLRAILAAQASGAAIPVLPLVDTVAEIDAAAGSSATRIARSCALCRRRNPSASGRSSRRIARWPKPGARISPMMPG